MKTLLFIVLMITGHFISEAQKLSADKVPAVVKAGLNKIHPSVAASWEREVANYEANVREGNKEVSVIPDSRGTIVETETEVSLNSLPASAQTYIKDQFNGKKLQEIAKIVKADGEVNYEVMVNHRDYLFDANGNHLNRKDKKEKD